jgi:PilZ domain
MDNDHSEDRRAQYRSHGRGSIELSAELIVEPGRSYPAEVVNTSAGGVRLAFPRQDLPRLAVGTPVEVHFWRAGIAKPLVASGQVGDQSLDPAPSTLGVRFTRRSELFGQLTPELWGPFNRRRRMRARFVNKRGPVVELESGGERWSGHLFDLSECGLGLDLDPVTAEDLGNHELLHARSEVPGELGAIHVAGIRVHRTPLGRGCRMGLAFDPTYSPDFDRQRGRIEHFVRQVGLSRTGRRP